MADIKISAMTAATDLISSVIPIVQGGTNKKAAISLFDTRYWATSGSTTITTPTIVGNLTFNGIPLISGSTNYLDINNGNVAGGVAIYVRSTQGATYGDFTITGKDVNFGDPELDFVANTGINVAPGGGQLVAGKGTLTTQYERHFNGTSADDFEYIIKSITGAGQETRHLMFTIQKATGHAIGFMSLFNGFDLRQTDAGSPYASFASDGTITSTGSGGYHLQNGTGTNAADFFISPTSGGAVTLTSDGTGNDARMIFSSPAGLTILNNTTVSATLGVTGTTTFSTNVNIVGVASKLGMGPEFTTQYLTMGTNGGAIDMHNPSGYYFRWYDGNNVAMNLHGTNDDLLLGVNAADNAKLYVVPAAKNSAWLPVFRLDAAANTALTASTAFPDVVFTGATQTWGAGTIAIQPRVWIKANTLAATSGTNTATVAAGLQVDPWAIGSGGAIPNNYTVYSNGVIGYPFTYTAGGTNGNQTINKPTGSLNIAATGTTVTLTNSLITANTIVVPVLSTDTTAKSVTTVVTAGQCVFTLNAACTAAVIIQFVLIN